MKTMGYVIKKVPPGKVMVGKFIGIFRKDKTYIGKVLSTKEENDGNHITFKILSGDDKGQNFSARYSPQSVYVFKTEAACRKQMKADGHNVD